jgi:hypothetical protein
LSHLRIGDGEKFPNLGDIEEVEEDFFLALTNKGICVC